MLAAGVWTPLVARDLKLNIPVQPARGYSLTMSATKVMPRHALLLGERSVAISPMGDLLRFTGRLELSNIDRKISAKQLAGIERAAREYLHLDEKLDIHETWAGLRPTTQMGCPSSGVRRATAIWSSPQDMPCSVCHWDQARVSWWRNWSTGKRRRLI